MRKTNTLLIIFVLSICNNTFSQLTVNYISATQFVQKMAGPGISFTNAFFSGTDPVQMGSFAGTVTPNIGITSGIILATGNVLVAVDTTNNCMAGNALGGGGDADLSGACQQQTRDLGAIEFDFWTASDTVQFSFMFASEEYNYWVNSKNDVCGARLYNALGGYANVLYLPGTFSPICVNNINNGSVPNICDPATGPCTNCSYFHDNLNGLNFQYNGYTDLFTVKFHVAPCDTFHFWLGIADAQDFIYDSAILLPDGAFSGTSGDLSCDSTTGFQTIYENYTMNIFPDPFNESIDVQTHQSDWYEITLFDITTRAVLKKIFNETAQFETINLSPGIYIYQVRNKSSIIKKGKLIKK